MGHPSSPPAKSPRARRLTAPIKGRQNELPLRSPGSGRTFQLTMPRCFAVAAACPHHIATLPHVRNAGRPRVQTLGGGWSAGPGLCIAPGRRRGWGERVMHPLLALVQILVLLAVLYPLVRAYRRRRTAKALATAPRRDVSALPDPGEAAFKHEVIKTGGPLKPQHRRLILRDNRLLP